jgi:hypothetical protein
MVNILLIYGYIYGYIYSTIFGLNSTIFMTTSQETLLLKPHYLLIWLVLSTPLKNISQLGWLFPTYGKIKNVPNISKPQTRI